MIIVPDTSVILKWVLEKEDEPDHDKAVQVQQAWLGESVEMRLPTLWRYEGGNVLGLKERKGTFYFSLRPLAGCAG